MTEREKKLALVAKKFDINYFRIFGSFLVNEKKASDVDILIPDISLNLKKYSAVHRELFNIFSKKIDLVRLHGKLPSTLIIEIAKSSVPLWEAKHGREEYAEKIDNLLAKAVDEKLSYPMDLKWQSFKNKQRGLYVT